MERDPARWYHGLMVDVGTREGVPLNAAVLAHAGGKVVVLGRIAEVSERTSKVLLVTDEFSSVAARLSSGTVEGLVQGQGTERLRMNYLHSEATVTPGDEVLTSATSATFPPGLLIGRVAKGYARDPFLAFQSAEVRPGFDPASVKEVMILK
jgi:rod shape-determining protein MreC